MVNSDDLTTAATDVSGMTNGTAAVKVARSPAFHERFRNSAPVSRLPEGSRPGDRISRI